MKLKESKAFLILTIVMLCSMLGILVFGFFYGYATKAFEDTIIEVIAQKVFLFDMYLALILFFIFLCSAFLNLDSNVEHVADLSETSEEFETFYNKLQDNGMDFYEEERKKIRKRKRNEKILRGFFIVTLLFYFIFEDETTVMLLGFSTIAYLNYLSANKKRIKSFESQYNDIIPNQIIKHLGYENIKFIPINSDKEVEYDDLYAKLYPTPNDKKTYYKNFIEGYMYNDLEIKLTDMYMARKSRSKSMVLNVFFSGYFGYLEFKRDLFNSFSITRKNTYDQKEIIRETNNEFFDKYFSLKSNNEMFKAGLIRDGIADAVARFYSATNIDLQIETRGEKVILKIFSSSIFEPTFSRNYKERIYTQYYFLDELFILIDEIYEIIKNNSY